MKTFDDLYSPIVVFTLLLKLSFIHVVAVVVLTKMNEDGIRTVLFFFVFPPLESHVL